MSHPDTYMEHSVYKLMCLVEALAAVKRCCYTNDYQFSWINTETHAYASSAIPQRELLFKKKQNYFPSNI